MKYFRVFIFTFFIFKTILFFPQKRESIPNIEFSYLELKKRILNPQTSNSDNLRYGKIYLNKAKEEGNVDEIINGYYYVGNGFKEFNLNLKYSDSAIQLAKDKKPEVLSLFYFFRGDIYYTEKKLKQALDSYLMANNCVDNKNIPLINKINYSIGLIKKTQGNYYEAIPIYKKCEETAYNYPESYYPLYILGLSELYNRINDIDKSEEYVSKGIQSYKNYMVGEYYLPYFISNRGKNFLLRKKYQKAINDLKSTLETIKKNGDFSNFAENCFYLGECYNKLHDDDESIYYYKKVDSVFNVKKDIYSVTIPAYEHLIDYYKKRGDYKNAIYYSDQFIKADKVLDENYKYITKNISKKYDIQKIISVKQDIISSLKRDKILFIVLVFGLFIILIILYFNFLKKKKELSSQKELYEEFIKRREGEILKKKNVTKKIETIDPSVVQQILDCLEEFEMNQTFLYDEYTVEMLASQFKTNSTYLSRVINEIKEQSFTQYINTLRITYIIDKLENDSKYLLYSIQALSDSCGYNSVQTFTRAFVNYTKMKPSEYIKQLKNK